VHVQIGDRHTTYNNCEHNKTAAATYGRDIQLTHACIPDNASGDKRVQDLRQTDPRDDRFEILARKNPLLRGLCLWVYDDIAFPRWRSGDDIRILWLHRDPGKGKTMVMTALSMKYPRGCTARPTQPVYHISSARARIATATRPLRFFEVSSTSRWTSSQDCVDTSKRGTTIPGQAVHANQACCARTNDHNTRSRA
jgi:hypothetical protein